MNDALTPEAWLRRAEEDLRAARACLESDPPILRPALFHAQQTAEKALKAVLSSQGTGSPPRTHDLEVLLDLAVLEVEGLQELSDDAVHLTRFAVAPRYPGDMEPVGADEAEEAVKRAEKVLSRVRTALGGDGDSE